MEKGYIDIYNIIFTFKGPKKFISWTSRRTQMTNSFFFLVLNIVDTPMEALVLLAIYLFSEGVFNLISS